MMKAAIYYQNGGPEVLRYEEVPDPICAPGFVLIKVEAISIEGGDTLSRRNSPMVSYPHIVGYQAAGEIIELGAHVTHLRLGQKVATVAVAGSHAELRAVPARNVWSIPEGFALGKAAVIPVAVGTADECLFEFGRLKAGETVLIQSGAGGVGIAAIQLAKRADATVLATASSDERLQRLVPYGMDHGINYKTEDVVQAVHRLTENRGVDLVVDPVGGTKLQASLASLGHRGRISFVGDAGREKTLLDVSSMREGNRSITGVFLGGEITTDRVHNNIQRLIDEAARGEFQVVIDRVFPLAEAAAAHAYIESRQAVGRVLLVP
jgi:NADPH2:quinone reductase